MENLKKHFKQNEWNLITDILENGKSSTWGELAIKYNIKFSCYFIILSANYRDICLMATRARGVPIFVLNLLSSFSLLFIIIGITISQ